MSRMKSEGRSGATASAEVELCVIKLSGAANLHGENARAVGHEAAAANNDTPDRNACFRLHLQGRIAHLLLDFKTSRLLLRILRNCLVDVCRHSPTILGDAGATDNFFTIHSRAANTFSSRPPDNWSSMDAKPV